MPPPQPISTQRVRALYQAYLSLASTWPRDPLRPERDFGAAIANAADSGFLAGPPPPPPPRPAASSRDQNAARDPSSAAGRTGTGAATTTTTQKAVEDAAELRSFSEREFVGAQDGLERLRTCRDDGFFKKYPPSEFTLQPASSPSYYEQLLRNIERAGRGEDMRPTLRERLSSFFRFE